MYATLEQTIGNTPLVRLLRIPGGANAERGNLILGKLEGSNPAGTVCVALRIAEQVEQARIVFIVCDRGDRYLSTGVFPV